MFELRERAHERSGFALGTQRRVDLPQRGLAAGIGEDAAHALGKVGRQIPGSIGLGGVEDEDDVDVGDIVEFACSGLAQGDDRKTDVGRLVDLRPRNGQGRIERGCGQVGQDGHDMVDDLVRGFRRQVVGDEAKHSVSVVPSQRLDPFISGHGGTRSRVVGVRTEDREHLSTQ